MDRPQVRRAKEKQNEVRLRETPPRSLSKSNEMRREWIRNAKDGNSEYCIHHTHSPGGSAAPPPLSAQFLASAWLQHADKCQVPDKGELCWAAHCFIVLAFPWCPEASFSSLLLEHPL